MKTKLLIAFVLLTSSIFAQNCTNFKQLYDYTHSKIPLSGGAGSHNGAYNYMLASDSYSSPSERSFRPTLFLFEILKYKQLLNIFTITPSANVCLIKKQKEVIPIVFNKLFKLFNKFTMVEADVA